jgi:hypothetical protein
VEVAIRKFESQYRLAPGDLAERRRLDQLRSNVLEDAFQIAVDQTGIGEEAELCIRSLFVPVRLRLDTSDVSIRASWSAALAAEIGRVIRHGPTTNLVIYHSHRQALLDLALGVARGNLRRAWAWRQLGLWRANHAAFESDAVNEFVSALQRTPAMVMPTLQTLARLGWLQSLSARMSSGHWEDLARAALFETRAGQLPEASEAAPPARALQEARNVLNRSRLLPAITSGALRRTTRDTRRAIAALAIMDVDPGLLRRETAPNLIGLIAEALTSAHGEISTALEKRTADAAREDLRSGSVDHEFAESTDGSADELAPEITDVTNDQRESAAPAGRSTSRRRAGKRILEPAGGSRVADDHKVERPNEETELVDLRQRSISRFAGLLFLIAIIEDLNLSERILDDELFAARPFAWTLHQLALVLAPIESCDPAALAFAGLSPDAKSPAEGEAPRSDDELRALNELAGLIVARLSALVELDEQTDISPLEFVTRRRGEIVADPGWIEVRFSLDDVSTEIRRAGLDLNPGYIPWLGVVVMFLYD